MAALAFIRSVVNVEVEGAVEITKVVSLVTNKLIDLARSQVQRERASVPTTTAPAARIWSGI